MNSLISITDHEHYLAIEIPPRLYARNARFLLTIIETAARRGKDSFVLDFEQCSGFDSSGLGVIAYLVQLLREKNLYLSFINLCPKVRGLMRSVGIEYSSSPVQYAAVA